MRHFSSQRDREFESASSSAESAANPTFVGVPVDAATVVPGASGLETEINALGVSSKQTDKARQALMRSARQAGFFAHGEDRLVRPNTQGPGTRPLSEADKKPDDNQRHNGGGGTTAGKAVSARLRKSFPISCVAFLRVCPRRALAGLHRSV